MQNLGLSKLKMERGALYETIVTTVNEDGSGNAAPIGVLCRNEKEITLYLYEGSHTLNNILREGKFAVNILDDPCIFALSTFTDLKLNYFKKYKEYVVLKDADAFFTNVVYKTRKINKKDPLGKSTLYLVNAKVKEIIMKNCIKPLNRATYAIIESLIYSSRFKIADKKTRERYIERIKEMKKLVKKVGTKKDKEVMKYIMQQVTRF